MALIFPELLFRKFCNLKKSKILKDTTSKQLEYIKLQILYQQRNLLYVIYPSCKNEMSFPFIELCFVLILPRISYRYIVPYLKIGS